MSTEASQPGGKGEFDRIAAESVRLVAEAAAEESEAEQLDMLNPVTAEEAAAAYEDLGPNAKPLSVLSHAREKRKGRKPGARNKRTDDTVAYLSQFGPDPAVAMMKILAEDELAMVQLSRQIDPTKKQMSTAEARAMRIRCAETLMPYFHGKKPVEVDATIRGVMLVEEVGGQLRETAGQVIDGVLGVLVDDDDPEREAGT